MLKTNFFRHFVFTLIVAIAIITTSIATAQSDYLNTGKQYYDRGQYSEAIQLWQQVVNKDNEIENIILSHNYQAIAYQDLAQWDKSEREINNAFNLLETVNNSFLYAQVLNTKGSLEFKTGNAQSAWETWVETEAIYRSLDEVQPLLRSQINQAQALRSLGFYQRAKTTLEQANKDLESLPNSLLKAKALQSLGVTLRAMGDISHRKKY